MKLIREIKDRAGKLVFKRWQILRTPWFSLFLHGFYDREGDRDLHCHDHPWSFWGVVLYGGYREVRHDTKNLTHRNVGPGSVIRMPAEGRYHRILSLNKDRSYSLVLASRSTRAWGYWTSLGWIEAKEYREMKTAGCLPGQPRLCPKLQVVR